MIVRVGTGAADDVVGVDAANDKLGVVRVGGVFAASGNYRIGDADGLVSSVGHGVFGVWNEFYPIRDVRDGHRRHDAGEEFLDGRNSLVGDRQDGECLVGNLDV